MANPASAISWRVLTIAIGIPAGLAARKAVNRIWQAARPDDPSHETANPDVGWRDAVGWAVLSGVGVAVGQLVATKGAASVWRNLVGSEPPPVRKAEKKAAKEPAAVS